jgi:hypothetical protein
MAQIMDKNIKAFNDHLPELVMKNEGKFALIIDGALDGTYGDYEDALRAGYAKDATGNFFVREIRAVQQVAYFSRDYAFQCQA